MKEEAVEEAELVFDAARAHRVRVITIVAPAFVGILAALVLALVDAEMLAYEWGIQSRLLVAVVLMSFTVSGLGALMMYLQTGFRRAEQGELRSVRYEAEFRKLRRDLDRARSTQIQLPQELEERVSRIERDLSETGQDSDGLSEEQRENLVQEIQSNLTARATEEYLADLRESVAGQASSDNTQQKINERFGGTLRRLNAELSTLTRRGHLNLSLGILTAGAGIGVLSLFVINLHPSDGSAMKFTENFVPRISLVILIEIFAYFFLRLYSRSLTEIKYFQNEITNVEAKYLALSVATQTLDEKVTTDVVSELARTERNYILSKGQTTVDLERSKLEKETLTALSHNIIKLLTRKP